VLVKMGLNVTLEEIINGRIDKYILNAPFTRFHESIEKNPHFLDDIDDVDMAYFDEWERVKPLQAKDGTTAGDSSVVPL